MTSRLLLDEIFGDDIAEQLRTKGHDVLAAAADSALTAMPDTAILAHASADGRAVVTRNIEDFLDLDSSYEATGTRHAGIVLVATKTFPHDGSAAGALVRALEKFLERGGVGAGTVAFLRR